MGSAMIVKILFNVESLTELSFMCYSNREGRGKMLPTAGKFQTGIVYDLMPTYFTKELSWKLSG